MQIFFILYNQSPIYLTVWGFTQWHNSGSEKVKYAAHKTWNLTLVIKTKTEFLNPSNQKMFIFYKDL